MNFKFICLAFLLVLTSNTYAQKKRVTSNVNVAETNASNTIRFSNAVITIANAAQGTKKYYNSTLETAESNLDNVANNRQLYAIRCGLSLIQPRHKTAYDAALKTAPAFEQKKLIVDLVKQGESDIANIEKWCQSLTTYFTSKQYEADADQTVYQSITDSLNLYLQKNTQTWADAADLASDAGNKAELILLQKSKIASFIIPMKEDLSALDKAFSLVRNQDVDTSVLRTQLQNLSQSVSKNKDVSTKDVSKLSDYYYREVYSEYYREMETTIGYLNKLADKLDDENMDSDGLNSTFSYASSGYNKVVEKYNSFIKQ